MIILLTANLMGFLLRVARSRHDFSTISREETNRICDPIPAIRGCDFRSLLFPTSEIIPFSYIILPRSQLRLDRWNARSLSRHASYTANKCLASHLFFLTSLPLLLLSHFQYWLIIYKHSCTFSRKQRLLVSLSLSPSPSLTVEHDLSVQGVKEADFMDCTGNSVSLIRWRFFKLRKTKASSESDYHLTKRYR